MSWSSPGSDPADMFLSSCFHRTSTTSMASLWLVTATDEKSSLCDSPFPLVRWYKLHICHARLGLRSSFQVVCPCRYSSRVAPSKVVLDVLHRIRRSTPNGDRPHQVSVTLLKPLGASGLSPLSRARS